MATIALYKILARNLPFLRNRVSVDSAGCLAKLFERLKAMSLSGSKDRLVPDGGYLVLSGVAGSRKATERLCLAQALRANLGRRKAQKIAQRKETADAAEGKTAQGEGAQNGAGPKRD